MAKEEDAAQLLEESRGEGGPALNEFIALAYDDLRRRAVSCLRRERPEHSLSPTALVHEAYLRLAEQKSVHCQDAAHFCALATSMMRRVLSNHARDRQCAKRGGGALHLPLDEAVAQAEERMARHRELDDALDSLAWVSPAQAKIVELFYFGGFNRNEIAQAIGVSVPTVGRHLRMARSWLQGQLSPSHRGTESPESR